MTLIKNLHHGGAETRRKTKPLKHRGAEEAEENLNTDNTDDPIKTDCQKVRKARAYRGLTRMNADQKENHTKARDTEKIR
jgi:hypothetical protein